MMQKLKNSMYILADMELQEARTNNPVFFNSPHEGLGVILEEMEEAAYEMNKAIHHYKAFKDAVKDDRAPENLKYFGDRAISGACELVQVAAMVTKYIQSMERWEVEHESCTVDRPDC